MKSIVRSLSALSLLFAFGGVLASCAPKVDMPKGTHEGYHSARFIKRAPGSSAAETATERQVHGLIQNSISKQFSAKGISFGGGSGDLAIAYLVVYQEPGMTATYDEYFGEGRDSSKITEVAHIRGTLENQRPDYFRQAGIVVDVIDSKTNKLVYRGFSKGDVVKGASANTRAARINAAVAESLAPFFN